jgi:hypothetical protein
MAESFRPRESPGVGRGSIPKPSHSSKSEGAADLLLLDEPLNAVDLNTRAVLHTVFQDLHQQGKTVLVAFAGLCVGRQCAWPS